MAGATYTVVNTNEANAASAALRSPGDDHRVLIAADESSRRGGVALPGGQTAQTLGLEGGAGLHFHRPQHA